jgi:hypothetical protein
MSYPDSTFGTRTAVLTVAHHTWPWRKDLDLGTNLQGAAINFIAECKNWGVYPDSTAALDRIPYSFVAGWVLTLGEFFEEVDNYLDLKDYFPVTEVISSLKYTKGMDITLLVPACPGTGVVEFSYYNRTISGELPLPAVHPLVVESALGKHSVETTALVFQRWSQLR